MKIVLHDPTAVGVEEFARLVRPLLDADPVRHTAPLTLLDSFLRVPQPVEHLLTLHDRGAVIGATLRTPGRPVHVSALPIPSMSAVAEALAEADPGVPGVAGPVAEAEAYAAVHTSRTGAVARVDRRTRLFALGTLVPPADVRGTARRAGVEDLDLLGDWRRAFAVEEAHAGVDPTSPREAAARSVAGGAGEILWEVDGSPVSQASARAVVAGMSRIGPVYTPPEHRRHGYAAAVTAAAASWALDAGAQQVVLFTDLANPTTNALYPRLGFEPVHDAVEFSFGG